MIAKSLLAAAIAVAVTPAFGATQLERSLGVSAGVYSTAELVRLRQAIEDGDRTRIAHIQSGSASEVVASRGNLSASVGELTTAEKSVIGVALEENDFDRARFVAEGGFRDRGRGVEVAKARIAYELGVDAGAYTLGQLTRLRNERED